MSKHEFLKQAIGETFPPDIERHVYRTTFNMPKAEQLLLANQRLTKDRVIAFMLATKMNCNAPGEFGGKEPKSAFYTWFRPQGLLVVETATEYFHDYLRVTFDYTARKRKFGAEVRSGHFCDGITFSPTETFPVATLDKISSADIIIPEHPEHLMLVTLAQNGVLPLTEDGFVPRVVFAKPKQT